MPISRQLLLITAAIIFSWDVANARSWRITGEYITAYESNVFHAFADSNVQGGWLNMIEFEARSTLGLSNQWTLLAEAEIDLDIYPNFSNRNRTSFGVTLRPEWEYSSVGELRFDVSLGRRNRDLIDDSGQLTTRTLERTEFEFEVRNRLRWFDITWDLSIGWVSRNYDEPALTVVRSPSDTLSYDYQALTFTSALRWNVTERLTLRGEAKNGSRDYDERKTYEAIGGARSTSDFRIREFDQITIALSGEYDVTPQVTAGLEVEWSDRSEIFDNFYGYQHRQIRFEVEAEPSDRWTIDASLRLRDKNYDVFWTSETNVNGTRTPVRVDYTDIRTEIVYELSSTVDLIGHFRSYSKESNDQDFTYDDVTIGAGVGFRLP